MKGIKTFTLALCAAAGISAEAVTFNILSCCPGEDTATEARFVWHSDSNACQLWYAKASAPGDAVQATCESVYKPVSFRSSDVNYYKYTAALSSLDPGTEYIYYVKSGSAQSATQRFKTAGTSGSYNFLWLSDVHSHPDDSAKTNSVNTIIANAKSAAGSLDFILFSGDMVKYGGRYDNWQQWNGNASFTEYMHALCPGNKEYYYNGSQTGVNGTSNRIHNKWFLACRNNPQNGADGIESSYWFIRDSVMFVAMDTLADEGVDMDTYVYNNAFALQTNWFDRVVSEQRSRRSFRYLVVFQHYPHFTYAEGDGFVYGSGRYKKWKDLFDKHKVDFALTGDHHNYSRSKKLRGGSENSEGTVYITAPEIGTSLYAPSVKSAANLNSYGVTSGDNPTVKTLMATAHNGDEAVGGVWFSVTPGKMTMHYIGKSSSPYDTVEVTPKDRGFVYSGGGTSGGDPIAHTRYRFKVDAPRSDSWCMQLSEIQLLDASGTAIPSNSFTIAYDSTTRPADGGDTYPSNESPPNAVDGNLDTKWLDWRAGLSESAATRSVVWLDFCFDSPTAVYGYRWYTANDASSRTPVSWTFSASDDGGTTWTVLDKVEGYDTTTNFKALAYSKRFADLPLPPTTAGGTYYALCVGLNEYSYVGPNLNGCVTDAKNVLSACTNVAKGLWSPANCHILTDSGATLSAVRAQFQALASQAASGDTVLYYHSSHGGVDELCTYNKDYTATDFASDLLRFKTGVRVIVLIDACHSASMFKGTDGESSSQGPWNFAASVEAHMAEIKKEWAEKGYKADNSPSVGWITACDEDELSLDWGSYYGGMFTYNFVNAWKSADTDANGDGYNDFLEIFNVAAPLATDEGRAPQKLNDDVLASVAAWRLVRAGEFTWTGGYDDNRISSGRNWEGGVAPVANSDATLLFPFTNNTTVLNDYASLSVKKIVFPASNYNASFTGGPVTIAENIVNNASVTNTFENAVTFGGNIDVTGEINFPGGVTGTVPANHTTFRGNYNLTTTGSWTPPSGSRVPSGSTFSMPNGTFYCHINSLTIERNATVTVNAAKIDRTNTAYLLGENDGLFKATGVLTSSGSVSGTKYHYLLHTSVENSSEGLLALDGIRIKGSPVVYANSYGGKYEMAIGNNGIKKDAGVAGYFLIRNDNKPEYIGSWCNGNDYKIAIVDSSGNYPTNTSEYVIYGSRTDRTYNINFDTTDCFNEGVRNTVRDMSPICGAAPANVSVGIYGGGEFRFENTAVNATGLYSGGTVVSNSATVAILAGSCPGRGDLTLRDTTTLSLPGAASGTVTVFGTLSLASGTTVSFGRLAAGTTPLSVGGLTVGAGSQKPVVSVNVSGLTAGTYPLIASSSATSATADSFTLTTSGTSDKTISLVKSGNNICLEVAGGIHGKWVGGSGGNRFSVAANWDDGVVPGAGDALNFSSVTSATTIEADVNATFGAVTMGSGVVTFTGNLTASSYSDLSKVTVGANATVTLVGDLTYTATTGGGWMLNRLDGVFVVTGKIIVSGSADMKLAQTVGANGVAVAKGLVSNGNTSWTFRLNRSNSGDTARWVIGEEGLSGGSGFWMLAASTSSNAILQPNTNDFTIADWVGAREGPSLTINTTGWGDNAGHVITAANAGFIREGEVSVIGAGTLVCDYDASSGAYGQSAHSVAFNVGGTATLALKAGSKIGTGNVTVNSGAALALSGSGTATMGGTLTLNGGSRLVVGAAGAGRLTAKGVSIAGNVAVEIPSQSAGTFTVLTRTDGTFSDSDLAKLSLSVASPNASFSSSFVLADSGKSIAISTVVVWPANWNEGHAANAAMQTAFTEWVATPGNDATAARAEGAFLLGLDLAEYTEDMKVVSVAIQGGKFTIDTNVDLTKVRGRLYVLVADSPADIEKSGTKINGTIADITKLVNIDASAPAKFFKVGIDYNLPN